MQAGEIVIDVQNGHAHVSRWKESADGLVCVPAVNAEELEAQAVQVIEGLGENLTRTDQYAAPEALAQQARWS